MAYILSIGYDLLERKIKCAEKFIGNSSLNKNISENIIDKKLKIDTLDKIYEKRMDVFFEVLGGQISQFGSFLGYIHKITNLKNKKVFIGGYHEILTKGKIINILSKT